MTQPDDPRPIPRIEMHIAGDTSAPRERHVSSALASSTPLLHYRQAPAWRAYQLLHLVFVLLPLLEGLDKLFAVFYRWDRFVAPLVLRQLEVNAALFLKIAGGIELAIAVLVYRWPRFGGALLLLWLCLGAANLCLLPGLSGLAVERLLLGLCVLAMLRLAEEFREGFRAVSDWAR